MFSKLKNVDNQPEKLYLNRDFVLIRDGIPLTYYPDYLSREYRVKFANILSTLLVLVLFVSILGCGEDEEIPTKDPKEVAGDSITTIPTSQKSGGKSNEGKPERIVWLKIEEDGVYEAVKDCDQEFENWGQVKKQRLIVVKVLDAYGEGVPNVRVDWVLNRWCDAVGDIIETDDPGFKMAPAFKADSALAPQIKIDNLFAVTFTNSKSETLEGRRKDGGNVAIGVGETWINIISNREGETEITAFCPAIKDEKGRIISAVRKWIDLDWKFPSDEETEVIDGKLSQRTIVTKLFRVDDEGNPPKRPVKVCYRILNDLNEGPEATFENGSETICVEEIDNEGRAVATIKLKHQPGNLKTGTNTIEAEIFLSAHGEEKCEYTVSQKFSQHWHCGPNFEITQKLVRSEISSDELESPASIGKLEEVQYNITVTNKSHCIAQDVILTYTFNAQILAFQGSDDGVYNNREVLWNLGDIKQGERRAVNVKLEARESSAGTINKAKVNYDVPPNDFITKVYLPELVISCEPSCDPNESIIRVKEQNIPEIKITVTNESSIARATEVRLEAVFSEKVEWRLPEPVRVNHSDSKTLIVKFSPKAEGDNTLYLRCEEWGEYKKEVLVVIEPAIEIVKFKDPAGPVTVGEETEIEVIIKNKGVVKVSIDQIIGKVPEEMEIKEVTTDKNIEKIDLHDGEAFTSSAFEIDAGAHVWLKPKIKVVKIEGVEDVDVVYFKITINYNSMGEIIPYSQEYSIIIEKKK